MASTAIARRTVDLSAYPELVVIDLGMRVNSFRGLGTLLKFGPKISAAVAAKPDGPLLHEPIIYSIFPPHFGMPSNGVTLNRWRVGPAPCRIRIGGAISCATAAAPDSGMKPISSAVAWKRFTITFPRDKRRNRREDFD